MSHKKNHEVNPVALITGAAQRIGAEIARTLHHHGFNIALHYRQSEEAAKALQIELEALRPESTALIKADLLESNACTHIIDSTLIRWNRLDLLVNNASSFYPTPIGEITEAQWEDLMGTNLKTPLFLSQAAAPYLLKTKGCIVNIVDIHGQRPLKDHPLYCAAKAGLIMLTQSLAREMGPEVRVNGIAPGSILWPNKEIEEETKEYIVNRTALKRQGSPQDIANAVRYLAMEADYVSGHILTVDGGRSLAM